jgi:broad specificity phosphatase PhoE
MPTPPQPATLWLVRHGESAANVAREAAFAAGDEEVAIAGRDPDVPLSPLGARQARALGRWFAARPAAERPTVVIASPYARARATAEHAVRAGAAADPALGPDRVALDERWREKELGLFFRLTQQGVERRYPEQWALAASSATSTTGRPTARAAPTWCCASAPSSTPWPASTPAGACSWSATRSPSSAPATRSRP